MDFNTVSCYAKNKVYGATNYVARPISASQVLIVWQKKLGPGYKFRIRTNVGAVVIKDLEGTLSFGRVQAYVVNGLQPSTEYTFFIRQECDLKPGDYSAEKNMTAKTLDPGKSPSRN